MHNKNKRIQRTNNPKTEYSKLACSTNNINMTRHTCDSKTNKNLVKQKCSPTGKTILILKKSPVKVEDKATQDGNSNNKYSVEKENIVNKAQTTNDKSQNNKFKVYLLYNNSDVIHLDK